MLRTLEASTGNKTFYWILGSMYVLFNNTWKTLLWDSLHKSETKDKPPSSKLNVKYS